MTDASDDILLDTHVLLWAGSNPERLGADVREVLVDPARRILVSAVTVAEVAIKVSLGKLRLPRPATELALDHGFDLVALEPEHAAGVARLPLLHRDPFDRLLIAQATVDGLTLATADRQILAYPDVRLLAAT